MPIVILICLVGIVATIYVSTKIIAPITNRIFASIWNDNEVVSADTIKRIKELYMDGEVPIETAVMMASTETGVDRGEILKALGASSPNDVAHIMRGGRASFLFRLARTMDKNRKKGTRA